ncbi:hybrid sensor histidine kinase/response regulator [Phormidium tenue FACHB-886]|nr:hybrid sensor histidine kinase/response regulator [Phormidium tenue FACHB-886]
MEKSSVILVVDDEPSSFDVIESILFGEGYELRYASSGAAALKRLEATLPDLILLDVMMPELDGVEACRRIKSAWQHIPVIMVTALSSKAVLARCLEMGADDFINKPVSAMELRARVRSMLRIKQQHDALQASLQLRQDLSDMIVHDLRNPITSILLSSAVLKRTELQEKQQRKVEQIMQAGQRLQSLVDSLLLLAKLESGKMLLERSAVDLCEVAGQAAADLQGIATSRQLTINIQLPDCSKALALDAALLRRVLDNLLSNAIKFSPSGGEVTLRVEFPAESRVRIEIADQGVGIQPELRQVIFEKYGVGQQINGATQTGIGLAFCKMAIEAHGGKIFVEENYPSGSLFVIEIPSHA